MRIERRAARERARLTRLLRDAGVKESEIALAKPVIENTAWMKEKLEDARISIRESAVAISYDNGGGQTGIRENPLFRGYEALWRAYTVGIRQILDLIPESKRGATGAEPAHPATVLAMLQAKREASGQ